MRGDTNAHRASLLERSGAADGQGPTFRDSGPFNTYFHPIAFSVGHVDLALQSPLIAQFLEPVQRLVERDQLAHFLSRRVVAVADVDSARLLLFGSDDCGAVLLAAYIMGGRCSRAEEREK